jgi:carbamoyltransferase
MNKNFTVLGINTGHDAGAAIIKNGKISAAINEERIRNIKHYNGIPEKSIQEVIKIAKIESNEIDLISIVGINNIDNADTPFETPYYLQLFYDYNSISTNSRKKQSNQTYLNKIRNITKIQNILEKLDIPQNEIMFCEHHLAHAATAYYLSPWDFEQEVLIITADAAGDGISSTINIGHRGKISRIEDSESNYYDSVGYCFYGQITKFLGMKINDHEYKVMGLAPYGNSSLTIDKMKEIIDIDENNPLKFKNKMGSFHPNIQQTFWKLLGDQRFDNIAAGAQEWFERIITKWIHNAIKETNIQKIVCAGGNFLNVKANKKISEMEEVEDIFICPASGDEGIAVGAALVGYNEALFRDGIKPEKIALEDVYFGTSFDNEYIKKSITKYGLLEKAEFFDEIDQEVGEKLSKSDNIIARFNGQMEWGPRGLGNRSILANPSNPEVVKKINHAIKMRDFWMPFGPSILEERMDEYLKLPKKSPYMIMAFDTTQKRKDIIATIHPFDNTCRPQTVNELHNSKYVNVIKEFESKTGVGALLNTSFNLHGFPIVYNPEIAIETFQNSKLDYLSLGNYLISK